MKKHIQNEFDGPVSKRSRKSLHITKNFSRNISAFIEVLDSQSIIIPDKRPNTEIKELGNYIQSVYDISSPECFLMNGEEYSGDKCLHELTREKYLYVPLQSGLDVEVKFFSLCKDEVLVKTLKTLGTTELDSLDRNLIDSIKYGVNIIRFYKRKIKKSKNNVVFAEFIPQILRGNTCEDANEEKINELMRHRFKSPPINIKQNIFQFKQLIETELMINLDKVDVFDLYKFHKLPEQLPLSTFITMTNDFTDFILSYRFKQMPKNNLICIVINQVIPVQFSYENKPDIPSMVSMTAAPPKEMLLPSLDPSKRADKEQWVIVDNFSHGCNIDNPKDWTALEIGLWFNYIRTSFNIVPNDRETELSLLKGAFYSVIMDKTRIMASFRPRDNGDRELILAIFVRHCELLVKYKLFYQFNKHIDKSVNSVCLTKRPSPPPQRKIRGPQGRSKAKREDLVKKSGGRREIQLNSKNLMDTKLGKSLYSGKNSTSATTISQFQHRKWTFFLRFLVQPRCANEVAWVDYDGIFRLMEQDIIARMYGETCNKPDMTYDKLSRGLRYDRSGIIDKVDKNYCWKFTVPIEEILGLSVETIVKKMYKYYNKRNSNYPADILLKESLAKKKTKPIGPMILLVRDPEEVANEDRLQAFIESEPCETVSRMGYMSTDRMINFWLNIDQIGEEKYNKRLNQGRLVHSVVPNETELIALTRLNDNNQVFENRYWMNEDIKMSPKTAQYLLKPDLSNKYLTNDNPSFDYENVVLTPGNGASDVEEELVIDNFFYNEHCLQ